MPGEKSSHGQTPWQRFYGPNLGYLNDLYEQYLEDPDSVDAQLKELFERWGEPPVTLNGAPRVPVAETRDAVDWEMMQKVAAAGKLARNIRTYGHLAANIDPLGERERQTDLFDPQAYGLNKEDLQAIPAHVVWRDAPRDVQNSYEAIERLRQIYTQSLGYEFDHVHDKEERMWLNRMVESGSLHAPLTNEEKIALLQRLTEVEGFETFLQSTFVGQKRFSIEGVDALVPLLDEIIRTGVKSGIENVMIGMAHRGRLNVLAHILGKPYEAIFSEFHRAPNKELVPSEGSMGINYGWTGDVKYHLGADASFKEGNVVRAHLTLANNPSHLEFVNPVVEGFTRAAQEDRKKAGAPEQDVTKAFAILVHGDAAFPGEGVVAETLNLSRLPGYRTGGTIHVIANNQIGFTTESADSRSTKYASDLAKGFEIPIVHVNADDVEACLAAARLACEYRLRFHKDFLIDLVGYRRLGHNEMDDPAATQPLLYEKIRQHPTVRQLYATRLVEQGVVTNEQVEEMERQVQSRLKEAYEKLEENGWETVPDPDSDFKVTSGMDTGVPLDQLREINRALLNWPEGFSVYPKLERILKRREQALDEGGTVDWAHGETLAFATILADGQPIRLTGQDSERGTFAHRHLVLHDVKTGQTYSPLHVLPQARASFAIHNSPLSEVSVLGFEYGYDVYAEEALVLWEAQFGDFANAAQVIIDQFISAGRAKWGQESSLVLLLPHGYEGQGPEHSSARLERFLELSAENNWSVLNLTTSAQYFHLLRRQAKAIEKKEAHPLVIMTPKSLLRNPRAASPVSAFVEGKFQPILEQPGLGESVERVERLILCSGKVAIDLLTELEGDAFEKERLHIVRVEQLYPFPQADIEAVVRRYKQLKEIVWVQEEPKNMGAWLYIEPKLQAIAPEGVPVRYIGRPPRSSPAEGLPDMHQAEQSRILLEALSFSTADTELVLGGHRRD